MRAPTVPAAHFAAVVLSTVALAGIVIMGASLIGPPIVWQVATPFVLMPCGFWLRWAWKTLQLQRRVFAAYGARMAQATGQPGAAKMTPEGLQRALGLEGYAARRPVSEERDK